MDGVFIQGLGRGNFMEFTSEITVELVDHMGTDESVIRAARVSTVGSECLESEPGEHAGLINYLMKHRHGTPFEHNAMTFFVHAPIFVWREWHRHRIGFCVSGDTLVMQETISNSGRTIRNRPIKDLWDNWHNGVTDRAHTRQTSGGVTIAVPERVRSLDSCRNFSMRVLNEETQFFELGKPVDVIQSGVKEMLLVDAGKYQLRCSADHRIYTDGGWVRAGDLRRNDLIAVCGRRSKNAERQVPPQLRRGIGVWTSMQRDRMIGEHDSCYICGVHCHRSELVMDHIVPVVADITKALDVSNLAPICAMCHKIKTASEQKLARRANVAGTKFVRLLSTPRPCSEEMSYDISMGGEHHNFIANGIVVHNSYNEESGRYKTLDPVFYVPPQERQMFKVEGWKPGRPKFMQIGECDSPSEASLDFEIITDNLEDSYRLSYEMYQRNLAFGVDPGLARDCLPVGIYSSCWVTCNARSLMSFLSLRTHEPTADRVSYPLYEIEVAARKCETIFSELFPLTYEAWVKNGRVSP